MPHSLRAKLGGLRYKGILEDKDYKRLCHALDLEKVEPFLNKLCVSNGVCEHDKNVVLDKIRAEIEQLRLHKAQFLTNDKKVCIDSQEVLDVIDKYKAESEKV